MTAYEINIDCGACELSESAIYSVEVIQACHEAMNEGTADEDILDIAHKYTKSLLVYVLDAAQQMLTKLVNSMIQAFHRYIVNDVRIVKKFKEIIIQKMQTLDPITYQYYTYDGLYEYPTPIKQSSANTLEITDMIDNVKKQEGPGTITVEEFIDKKIRQFSKSVLGKEVNPIDITRYTTEVTTDVVRGKPIMRTLAKNNITEFYDDLERTVREKKRVYAIRNEINQYYKELKNEINQIYKDSERAPAMDRNPNYRAAKVTMNNVDGKVSRVEMQRNRLLNAYIQIYRTAFTTKINIIKDKISADAELIATVCKRSSIFATLGGH